MKKYEPFKAKCIKTVDINSLSFLKGNVYDSCWPEVWPDTSQTLALIDHDGAEHFMDWKWFYEHFEKL